VKITRLPGGRIHVDTPWFEATFYGAASSQDASAFSDPNRPEKSQPGACMGLRLCWNEQNEAKWAVSASVTT
jgi:hypothetical protein